MNKMSAPLKIIKIGGNVIDNPESLGAFVSDFARMEGRKILVHGGGKEATRLSVALDIPTVMIEGRRVTDRDTLDIVTMVYAGLVNKRIVSKLQSCGCDCIGMTGADGNIITAVKRPVNPIDYGYVGDIYPDRINVERLLLLVDAGLTPVICAIMHDGKGNLLNCNADSVAQSVATACAKYVPVELVYCFEKDGVLADVDDPSTVIAEINPETFAELKAQGIIHSGMIPKINNAITALESGVSKVVIKNSTGLLKKCGTTLSL